MVNAQDLLSTRYVRADETDSVSKLFGKLKLKKSIEALVFKGNSYVGLVDERRFLKVHIDTAKTKVKKLIKRSPKLVPTTSLEECARLLVAADSVLLPVVHKNQVKGVVYVWDVLKELIKDKKLSQLHCLEVSKGKKLQTLKENDSISKAISVFKKQGINRLPVVRKGKLVGILTPLDLVKKYYIFNLNKEGRSGKNMAKSHLAKEVHIPQLPIKNEMGFAVTTVDVADKLGKAVRKMLQEKITAVILTKLGSPHSILTCNDVLRLY